MTAPKSVAIVGLGSTMAAYANLVAVRGSRRAVAEETWVINTAAEIFQHDRAYFMDDMLATDPAAPETAPQWRAMLGWLKTHPGPVYTSTVYKHLCPNAVEFPLAEVVEKLGYSYFNTTVAYAIGHALAMGVPTIGLWGCDFTYPNKHEAEAGRACCEFWLGYAARSGINLTFPDSTTLMDAFVSEENRLYGYADLIELEKDATGSLKMARKPRTAKTGVMRPGHDTMKIT